MRGFLHVLLRRHRMDWKEEGDPLSCGKTETVNHYLLKIGFSYARSPITRPQFQSALSASCSYLQVLGSPTCPCKFLKTLVIHTLKNLG